MVPLIPKSVKLEPEISTRLKATASLLGYSENQLVAESLKSTLDGAEDESNAIPRLFVLIRTARKYGKAPPRFGERTRIPESKRSLAWWWAT